MCFVSLAEITAHRLVRIVHDGTALSDCSVQTLTLKVSKQKDLLC